MAGKGGYSADNGSRQDLVLIEPSSSFPQEVMGLSASSPGSFIPQKGSRLGSRWATATQFSDFIRLMEKATWGQATMFLCLFFLAKLTVWDGGFWSFGSAGKATKHNEKGAMGTSPSYCQ